MHKFQCYISTIDTQDLSIDTVLKEVQIDLDEYIHSLQISQRGTNIILKCNVQDLFLNACNIDILALWRGNMDLQLVIDEMAAIIYICSYMTKGEKAMGETLK